MILAGEVLHLWAEEHFHFPETFCGTGKLGEFGRLNCAVLLKPGKGQPWRAPAHLR